MRLGSNSSITGGGSGLLALQRVDAGGKYRVEVFAVGLASLEIQR